MIEAFTWVAASLGAIGALLVLLLALRRLAIVREERIRTELEERLRPLALALLDGDEVVEPVDARAAEVLAAVVARYGRSLSGEARRHAAAFFEARGEVDTALAALATRRAWRRATAAHLLGDIGSERAVPALLAALDDPDRAVRAAAARSLGRLQALDAVEPLVYALADHSVPRAVAGQALLTIGPAALPPLRRMERRAEPEVRASAVELVGLLGDASEASLLIERLRDSSAEARAKAARALGRLGAADGAVALRDALGDRIPFVRVAAAFALGAVGDRDAVAALLVAAREDRFEIAQAAVRALARIDGRALAAAARRPDASPHLLEALDLAEARAR